MSFKNEIINGVELYTVSAVATETYQREAHTNSKMNNFELERKLTALALASEKVSDISDCKSIYRFGGFAMVINNKTHKIEVVYWDKDNHKSKVTKQQNDRLLACYEKLGLNKRGRLRQTDVSDSKLAG